MSKFFVFEYRAALVKIGAVWMGSFWGLFLCFMLAEPVGAAMSVSASYTHAQKHQLAFLAAEKKFKAQLEDERIARAETLPQVNAGIALGQRNFNDRENPVLDSDSDFSSLTLSFSMPLYNAALHAATQVVLNTVELAQVNLIALRQQLLMQVLDAYANVLDSHNALEASLESEKALERQLKRVQALFAQKRVIEADVLLIESQFALQQVEVANKRLQRRNAAEIYLRTIGWNVTQPPHQGIYNVAQDAAFSGFELDANAEQQLKQDNLALRSQRLQQSVAEQQLKVYESSRYPSVALSMTHQRSDRQGLGLDFDQTESTIAVNLSVPLYTGGKTSAQIRQNAMLYEAASEDFEDAQERVTQQFLHAKRSLDLLSREIPAREKVVQAAISTVQATNASYQENRVTISQLLEAQSDLRSARSELAAAKTRYMRVALQLRQMIESDQEHDHSRWMDQWLDRDAPIAISYKAP